MRWIYISPHLDDAIFSAGGLIYEQISAGASVEIWTVMSGIPYNAELTDFAQKLHSLWGASSAKEAMQIRRAENEDAAKVLGAKTSYLDFLDCMYRRSPHGEALYKNSFSVPHKTERGLPAQIARTLAERVQPDDILVCPLALGKHTDHVVVRKAVELLGQSPVYIADIPYSLNKPLALNSEVSGMTESFQEISAAGLTLWLDAATAYKSQIAIEFQTPKWMREQITVYWAGQNGIRFWQGMTDKRRNNLQVFDFLRSLINKR